VLLDALAFALLALFTALGARRGTIGSAGALVALIAGYAAAVLAAIEVGPALARELGIPSLLGSVGAGTAAFVVVALAIGLLSGVLRRSADERRGEAPRSLVDRLGGALFGMARGGLAVLMLGLLALWLDAASLLASDAPLDPVPPQDPPLRVVTRAAIETGVDAATPQGARGEAGEVRVLTRPAVTLGAFRTFAEHPQLPALLDDAEFCSAVESLHVARALSRPSARGLTTDPALREALAGAGVIDAADAHDPARFDAALAHALAEAGPRIARLRSDPELLRLAEDPEIAAALERGDVFSLVANPQLRQLAARAMSAPPRP
jgi:uncharacterized membrane protein required for colicin V production